MYHGSFSLERALAGFGFSVAIGIPLGAAMARPRLFEAVFEPLFSFSYPVPKIALYPILIFIFGGSGSKIALVFLECLYPITVNAYFGIRGVEPASLRAAQKMGARPGRLFWQVVVPAAAPDIFAGIRIALPLAFIVVIFGGNDRGERRLRLLHRLPVGVLRFCRLDGWDRCGRYHGFHARSRVGAAALSSDILGTFRASGPLMVGAQRVAR